MEKMWNWTLQLNYLKYSELNDRKLILWGLYKHKKTGKDLPSGFNFLIFFRQHNRQDWLPLIPRTALDFEGEYLFRTGPDNNHLKQTTGRPFFSRAIPGHLQDIPNNSGVIITVFRVLYRSFNDPPYGNGTSHRIFIPGFRKRDKLVQIDQHPIFQRLLPGITTDNFPK